VDRWRRSGLPAVRRLTQTALVAAVLLAVIMPFLVHVRISSGRWGLGSKLSNFVRTRPTLEAWVRRNDAMPYCKVHYALNEQGTDLADAYWGVAQWHRDNRGPGSVASGMQLMTSPDFSWIGTLLAVFAAPPVPLVPGVAWLIGIGGCVLVMSRENVRRWIGIPAVLSAALVLTAITLYTLARFVLPMVLWCVGERDGYFLLPPHSVGVFSGIAPCSCGCGDVLATTH